MASSFRRRSAGAAGWHGVQQAGGAAAAQACGTRAAALAASPAAVATKAARSAAAAMAPRAQPPLVYSEGSHVGVRQIVALTGGFTG